MKDDHIYNVSINNLQTYIDSISKIFSNNNDLVLESQEFFNGTLAESFYSKYNEFESNYKRILDNLSSYRSDVIRKHEGDNNE